jgi:hypothetical protein
VSWKKFLLSINSIGILLLWLGPPFIYFLKALIMPNSISFLFTGFFYGLGICLMLITVNNKFGFLPNLHLLLFGGVFFFISQLYLFLYNLERQSFNLDVLSLILILLYFLFLLKTDNEIKDIMPFWIFIFTLIINLSLLYSISTNPLYSFGVRATVQFGTDDFTGNPYIYAKNGFAGFIISTLLLKFRNSPIKYYSNFFVQFFSHVNLWVSVVVIFLTQTRSMFLSFTIILIPLLFLSRNNSVIKATLKINYALYLFYSFLMILFTFFNIKYSIIDVVSNIFLHSYETFSGAIGTALSMGTISQDSSAMSRVFTLEYLIKLIQERPELLLIGGGYRFLYLDIPVLEVLINFGMLNFIFYLVFTFYLLKFSFKAIFSSNVFQIFLGYMSVQLFIASFTSGRPLDFSFWISYLIFIRFFENDFAISKSKAI